MTRFIRAIVWVALLGFVSSQVLADGSPPADAKLDLFLLIGQSNMAGRGKPEAIDKTPHPRVWALNQKDQWVPAVDPLHFDKPNIAGVGLGLTFGKTLADATPGRQIGLIPCAVGGTSIDQWKKGGTLYTEAIRRTKVALAHGHLAGILWHQGESDSTAAKQPGYSAKLDTLVADLRTELDAPAIPFILGQLGPFRMAKAPDTEAMNAVLMKFPEAHPNTACVDASGTKSIGDDTHFDAASQRELGRRYAAAYVNLTASKKSPSTTQSVRKPTTDAGTDLTIGQAKTGKNGARFLKLHDQYVARAKQRDIDLLFLGDSITERWNLAPEVWKANYAPLKAANFGIGGDGVQHVLWRVENGELEGISPKVIVLMIGTNNSNSHDAGQIIDGIHRLIQTVQTKCPTSRILLLAIFPRAKPMDTVQSDVIAKINPVIAKLDDGDKIRFLDIGAKFLDTSGKLRQDLMPDFLHPNSAGYQIWADAMRPLLTEMMAK